MKIATFLLAFFATLALFSQAEAQFGGVHGGRSGISFQYRSGRLNINGVIGSGYGGANWIGSPYGPVIPFGAAPWGVYQNQTVVTVVRPTVVVPPAEPTYDVTGVDLDLVNPPERIGPRKERPQPPEFQPPEIPGKDVSVPRPPVRPNDPQAPKGKPNLPEPPPLPPAQEPLKNPKDEALRQIFLGKAAFHGKEYGLATQRFRLATQIDPRNLEGYLCLAQSYFAMGQYQEAVATIYRGMDREADWPLLNFRPRFDLYQGIESEFEAQLAQLAKVVEQQPQAEIFLFLNAHQFWFDNKKADAERLFRRARQVSANPTYIDRFLRAALPGAVVSSKKIK